ncbi:MAG TPA: M20/M25/M40 family metallo-hydrolase [Gemmatimonadales bacterium]|nr:M20/M25/M40 family metallo-hydrolase [Gemmatimonadales bacterium]
MPSGMRSLVLIASLAGAASLSAQTSLEDEAVQRLIQYLKINTTNPPGNEDQTMQFFARIFAQEGIAFDTASSAPGRGNIWARLKGGSAPALVLLHHMDVVPADARYWRVDPFSAVVQDSEIYARGALDTKSLGIVELEAFLSLHRRHVTLARDVIFMATADEEAGGSFGAGWVVQHHPEAFRGAGMLLNEGGDGTVEDGRKQMGIEVTQKVPLWLRLISTGEPGHGSIPPVASSVNRLVRALDRLQTYQFAPRVVPAVDTYFKALAQNAAPEWKAPFLDLARAIADPRLLLRLQLEAPELAALVRNTCSITRLEASNKINVIPPEARAEIDCRLLPDQDRQAFLVELGAVLNDPGIKIEQIMGFTAAVSPVDNPLYNALVSVTRRYFPDANVVPQVSTGFTDSHFFRDLGINCYGYAPFMVPSDEQSGVHGNNERISIANVRRGTTMMRDIVDMVVTVH